MTPTYSWQRVQPPRTASVTKRTMAFGADAVIVFGLAWLLTFVLAALGVLSVPDIKVLGQNNRAAGLLWLVSIFELPILLAYFTVLEGFGGRTPGKILLTLRVANIDKSPTDVFHAFLRNLLRLLWVTPFGPAFILLDWWSLAATELDQRMGDLAAGTVVLDERA
ncbi:MAG: RDD family protein [Candidatus Thermoplasmatota archaeon]